MASSFPNLVWVSVGQQCAWTAPTVKKKAFLSCKSARNGLQRHVIESESFWITLVSDKVHDFSQITGWTEHLIHNSELNDLQNCTLTVMNLFINESHYVANRELDSKWNQLSSWSMLEITVKQETEAWNYLTNKLILKINRYRAHICKDRSLCAKGKLSLYAICPK